MQPPNRRHNDLLRARQDRLELTRLRARIADARHDRARVAEQLASAQEAHAYRIEDHDALADGFVGWFRRLVAEVPDLTEAQQDLAAATLLCRELEDELKACDTYLERLAARAGTLADADERYAQALALVEREATANGALADELDEIAVTQAELGASRFEIRESIELAIGLQQASDRVTAMIRDFEAKTSDPELEILWDIGQAVLGRTGERYGELCAELAQLHHGLRMFDQLCRRLTSLVPGSFELTVVPLPSTTSFVFRNIVGATAVLDPIVLELARVSSMLVSASGELHEREAKLDRAIVECGEMRARLLERYAISAT